MATTSLNFASLIEAFPINVAPVPKSLADVRQWAYAYLMAAVREAAKEQLEGAEKKAAVLAGLDSVVDKLMAYLPLPMWAFWVRPILTALLKRELRSMAENTIEAILNYQKGNV